MTREELEQLNDLIKEIKMIEDQIKSVNYEVVSDSVTGSSPNFPYIYHSISIVGLDLETHKAKVSRLQKQLEDRRKKVFQALCNINDFLDTVDGSRERQLITLRYIEGYTWGSIATQLNYADESAPRKATERYLDKRVK